MILMGNTGSGKTTQIPQFVVDALYAESSDMKLLVGCTQPRRIAATSVARRVADEMDLEIGQEVGYSIRFEDCTSPRTVLKYLTDGMLLREAMADPHLKSYKVIILDEAHERTLPTDILCGLLKNALEERLDLKLIVMSATIELEKFQNYFRGAPVMKFPGSLHPVEILYIDKHESDYVDAAVKTAVHIHTTEPSGDILVFLTGEKEINDACSKISEEVGTLGDKVGPVKVLPLYSALPPAFQEKVFEPFEPATEDGGLPCRKIVVSTNIAETSLTVEGIVYVIDSGFAKEKVYNHMTCAESLLVRRISKASALQRSGRAGRTTPGKCFRLYLPNTFDNVMQPYTCPVILKANLADTVLTLKRMGVANLMQFDFIDPPEPLRLKRALEVLNYLGAIDDSGNLTRMGLLMSEFPVEVQMAKMIIDSPKFNCAAEILSISAMLSVPNCFLEAPKAKFLNGYGDHLTLLKVYDEYKRKNDEDRDWCQKNCINDIGMDTVQNIRDQLLRIMTRFDPQCSTVSHSRNYNYTNIRKAILSGYFLQVAHLQYTGGYSTFNDNGWYLHPSTCLGDNSTCLAGKPDWVVYHESVFTTKKFIRTLTQIRPEWFGEVSPHYNLANFNFTSRSHFDRFSKTACNIMDDMIEGARKDKSCNIMNDMIEGARKDKRFKGEGRPYCGGTQLSDPRVSSPQNKAEERS